MAFDRTAYMRDYMRKRRAAGKHRRPVYPWRKVIYSADCDADGNCPVCKIDYGECACPGPTMEGLDYRWIYGELYARLSTSK